MILAHETSVPAGLLAQPRADLVALLRRRVTMLAASEAMNANRLGQPGTQLKVPEHPGYGKCARELNRSGRGLVASIFDTRKEAKTVCLRLDRYDHGDPDNVIAFTMVCCCTSCDNSSGAVEGPQPHPLGA
jgi:hypothetical protein